MAKYGRGLNREIVAAVNVGLIDEPFSTREIRKLITLKKWVPEPTDNYINVALANGSSDKHSPTYKKYFFSVGNGQYKVKAKYKGGEWH
jgi:hypothetical protein